jgi:hypothetical protein
MRHVAATLALMLKLEVDVEDNNSQLMMPLAGP